MLSMWKRVLTLLVVAIGLAFIGLPVETLAKEKKEKKERQAKKLKTRRVPTMREQVYKRLAKVQEFMDAKDAESAKALLIELTQRRNQNSFEAASVNNLLAYLAYTEEHYKEAIEYYKKVIIDPGAIPIGLELGTLYTLGQLHFISEDYKHTIQYLEEWFAKVQEPSPGPYIFLAQVYYQQDNYKKAFEIAQSARKMAEERNLTFREHWWALLRTLHYMREEYDEVLEILEILVRDYPKREYWIQLSGMYGHKLKPEKQRLALDSAYVDEQLTKESELLNLIGLLIQSDVPYRAAVILDTAMEAEIVEKTSKNMELLGQAWQLSGETEKAIPAYIAASKEIKEGRLHLYLAQLYLNRERYKSCSTEADEAIRKGELRHEILAYEIQGMCRLNRALINEAKDSFEEAWHLAGEERDETAIDRIAQWLRYVEQESKRLAALGKS